MSAKLAQVRIGDIEMQVPEVEACGGTKPGTDRAILRLELTRGLSPAGRMAGPAAYNISSIYRSFVTAGQAARSRKQLAIEFGSAFLKCLAAQLATVQLQGVGQGWDAVEIEAAVTQFDQGDGISGEADLARRLRLG